MKRIVCALCIGMVAVCLASAAGQSDTAAADNGLVTLTMMARNNAYHGPWEEYEVFQALEAESGVHFEFILASEGFDEKKNLALATGDLPDVFLGSLTLQDEETYGPQGELVALNPLIDEYAPNITRALEEYPIMKKSITASDGNIYALGQVTFTQTQGAYKMNLNTEWLANLGLDRPETVDEFYAMLKAFKEDDPDGNGKNDEVPMTDEGFPRLNGWLMCAFGETYGSGHGSLVSVKNDKVTLTPATEGYRAYIEFLNKLYEEELLDREFISQSGEEYIAKTKAMKSGVYGHPGQADWTKLSVIAPLTSAWNSEKIATGLPHYVTGGYAITRVNEHPVESIKWADLLHRHYTNGVNGVSGVTLWLGQQGKHWDNAEGGSAVSYVFEPEGDLTHWLTFLKRIGPGGGVGVRVMDKPFTGAYQGWVAQGNVMSAFPYQKDERLYPNAIRFTSDETAKLSILYTDINTYVEQMQAKFVVGQEPLSSWDSFLNTLERIGSAEYIEILQRGYDRYNQ